MKKVAIIGGGLSGLYAAALLEQHAKVTLFEARERLGGRVHTIDGFDLGPSWIWPHQKRIGSLVHSLGLEVVAQYDQGDALYETPQKIERFLPSPNPPSGRIKGGVGKLIESLASKLTHTKLHLGEPILSIQEKEDQIIVQSTEGEYGFDSVILTLPPRLAVESLRFDPPLSSAIRQSFEAIPTWMGHCAKCVIEFEKPFWREWGLSGFCFSLCGPMGEIHDACNEGRYALFGFINAHVDRENLEESIRNQCRRLFGTDGERILRIYLVDWNRERFSAVAKDAISPRNHPNYGVRVSHGRENIHFIGTETSFDEGGYLEGAIASAQNVVKKFIP